ncbi:hypothetical protein T4B_10854 [Trichinella pseudospiralis]|uniref:Uncharacterized protein n=1 Tax=Trichinella pseudospiralis TaxID=6337 RepID=A0A0V1HG39_TRIPS|nr:hypothetical protein T4B_10854 [Trichinella pseudospiralis]KRZ41672.1 hypothetical protein T4C_8077 [Trichinella pseudospiralis]
MNQPSLPTPVVDYATPSESRSNLTIEFPRATHGEWTICDVQVAVGGLLPLTASQNVLTHLPPSVRPT